MSKYCIAVGVRLFPSTSIDRFSMPTYGKIKFGAPVYTLASLTIDAKVIQLNTC